MDLLFCYCEILIGNLCIGGVNLTSKNILFLGSLTILRENFFEIRVIHIIADGRE